MNFPDLWADVLRRKGGATAIRNPDGSAARSFDDVDREADAVAASLPIDGPGAVVSLRASNGPAWLARVLGIWKAGGCALLIDASLPESAAANAEETCEAACRIEDDGIVSRSGRAIQSPFDLIKLTSGTTGDPRPLGFRARQLLADCDQICATMGIGENDLNYGLVAFSHSYGFSSLITPLICRGIPLVAANDALPRAVATGLNATAATVLPTVPAILGTLASLDTELPALRLCISAGAPLPAAVGKAFRERFRTKVHSFYGASECGGICYDRSEDPIDVDGYVGTPMEGVEISELDGDDEDGFKVAVGSAAVCVSDFGGGSVEKGWFFPADRLVRHGSGFRVVGRDSDIINVAGRKVNPLEVEHLIRSCPGVEDAVVFGVDDPGRGQSVNAWVIGSADLRTIRNFCTQRLASWQMPREIRLVEQIPMGARGKINRRHIAQLHAGGDGLASS